MEESKVVSPRNSCDCECDGCEIGYHCGRTGACDNPTWGDIEPTIRKQESELDYLERPKP
jgi:hypothetical protein